MFFEKLNFFSTSHIQLLLKLISAFWRLLANKPRCKLLTRASLPGLTRIDVTVKAMVDVIHAVSGRSCSLNVNINFILIFILIIKSKQLLSEVEINFVALQPV